MKKSKTSYLRLKELVENGHINIRLILSPPRTGSTLMETKLAQFNEIQTSCHEPFVDLGYYNGEAEKGYTNILSAVGNSPTDEQTILVKEMSHWLGINKEFKRFLPLVNDPVLFLIRNPLLSMESKIRKVLEVWSIKEKPKLINWLKQELEIESSSGGLHFQRYLLDEFAQNEGKECWISLLEGKFAEQDYRVFRDLLNIEGLFPLSSAGWKALQVEMDYLKRLNREYLVVDSTIFRLRPQSHLDEIAQMWNIHKEGSVDYKPEEIEKLRIRMHKPHHRLWYDTLLENQEVKPPTEPIPELNSFPDEISAYLRETGIPIYAQAFMDKHRITIEGCNPAALREYDSYIARLLELRSFKERKDDFYGRRK